MFNIGINILKSKLVYKAKISLIIILVIYILIILYLETKVVYLYNSLLSLYSCLSCLVAALSEPIGVPTLGINLSLLLS
jgi:hypothetical protein